MGNRRRHTISAPFGLLACAAVTAQPPTATGQTVPRGYEIIDITRDNGRDEFAPRINNNGVVVYASDNPGSWNDAEIWTFDSVSGILTQITDNQVRDIFPDIADDGTIVWMSYIGPDVGQGTTPEIMMRTPDGQVTRITENSVFDVQPVINNRRQVVWNQNGPPGCGAPVKDIYMYEAGRIVAITTTGMSDNLENQAAEINDLGQIVWVEYNFCNPPPPFNFTSRIMLYSDGEVQAAFGDVTPQGPDISDTSMVVWSDYNLVTAQYDIYARDSNGAVTVIVDGGISAAVNQTSQIAFTRNLSGSQYDVFLWEHQSVTRITQNSLQEFIPAINNRGEIVWRVGPQVPDMDVRMLRRFALGDLNCDRLIDARDVEPFILALTDKAAYDVSHPTCDPFLADVNQDGVADAFDIEPFIEVLFP